MAIVCTSVYHLFKSYSVAFDPVFICADIGPHFAWYVHIALYHKSEEK